jgi:ATP-dependent RNA helicase RhlE
VDREEVPFIKDIQKLIKQEIPVETSHPYLPGTHVAEANDAKPFYNDGNNGNQRVARKKANLKNNSGFSNAGDSNFSAPARKDSNSGSSARNDRRDQPSNDAPKPKPAGPAKPFTRFKPRD